MSNLGFSNYDLWKTNPPEPEYDIDEDAEYFEKHKEEIAKEFQKTYPEDCVTIQEIIEDLSAELWDFYRKEYL